MKHPDPEKCAVLGMTFLFMHERYGDEAKVKMMSTEWNGCGTPACHAGWFAHSQNKDCRTGYRYSGSADEMARFLGLEGGYDLEIWAGKYPNLWGSSSWGMFASSNAFNSTDEEINLKVISEHWMGVAERIANIGQ